MVFQPSTQDLCFLPLERRTKWLVLQDHEWTQVGSTENTSSLHSDDTMSWRQAEVIRSCGPCWRHPAFAWSRVVYFETWLHYHSSRCVGRYAKMTKPHWYFKRLKFKAYMKTTCVLHSYLSLHWWTTSCISRIYFLAPWEHQHGSHGCWFPIDSAKVSGPSNLGHFSIRLRL